ncbi:MAG: hypothetical protein VKK42_08505 [Lyngbya sp.]|nr:hypothetical protein [Lyngbya sp.]
MSIIHPSQTQNYLWENRWIAVAKSRFWQILFLAIGTGSTIIYPHAPLVAFGTIAGTTLNRKRAILLGLIVWLVNQLYGFLIRDYPRSPDAFAWGLIMGAGVVLVTGFASIRPRFSRQQTFGHVLWIILAAIFGFVLYESLILLAFPVLTDGHSMGWNILQKLFVKNMIWTAGLGICYGLVLRLTTQFSAQQSS